MAKRRPSCLLCVCCLLIASPGASRAAEPPNLLGEKPFASGWTCAGRETSLHHREEGHELEVVDLGDQKGELAGAYVPIGEGATYEIGAEMRVSGERESSALLEVIFADEKKQYRGNRPRLARSSSTDWLQVRQRVDVPPGLGIRFIRLRLIPADTDSAATGAARLRNVFIREWSVWGADLVTAMPASWTSAGRNTSCRFLENEKAIEVSDQGDQIGQANSPYLPVAPSQKCRVTGELKVVGDPGTSATIDVQWFASDKKYLGRTAALITADASDWKRGDRVVTAHPNAAFLSVRVMPAADAPPKTGKALVRSVVVVAGEDRIKLRGEFQRRDATDDDPDALRAEYPDRDLPAPPDAVFRFGFEEVAGWEVRFRGDVQAALVRSRRERCQGDYVGRLNVAAGGGLCEVVVGPKEPIRIDGDVDYLAFWLLRSAPGFRSANDLYFNAPDLSLAIAKPDGQTVELPLGRVTWNGWSVVKSPSLRGVAGPIEFVGIALTGLDEDADYFCMDEISFCAADAGKIDVPMLHDIGEPPSPGFVPPLPNERHETTVQEDRESWELVYQGDSETIRYVYTPRTGALDDIVAVPPGGGPVAVFAEGGVVFDVEKGGVARDGELLDCTADGDSVVARWRFSRQAADTTVTYRMSLRGKALIVCADSDSDAVAAFDMGKVGDASWRGVHVPYLLIHNAPDIYDTGLVRGQVFVTRLYDFYGSTFSSMDWHRPHCAFYEKLTDGTRNPLHVTFFAALSSDLMETLPEIPHAPSTLAKEWSEYLFVRDCLRYTTADDREKTLLFLRRAKRLGMDRLINKHHIGVYASLEHPGRRPAMLTDATNEDIEGGYDAMTQYFQDVKNLGFKQCLYTTYIEMDPLSDLFNFANASHLSDGSYRPGWRHCKRISALCAPWAAAEMSRRINERFDPDLVYDDQMTRSRPWDCVDMDARKPYAGRVDRALWAMNQVPLIENKTYGGPAYGEGGWHWFYAGNFDGSYAQGFWGPAGGADKHPWLVDFDLLRIHPLETDIAMGYSPANYGLSSGDHDREWLFDRFLAASIAFGHLGIMCDWKYDALTHEALTDMPIGAIDPLIVRQYFLMQGIQTRYAMVKAADIAYERDGVFHRTSDALRAGVVGDNHVRVRYENGFELHVNGSTQTDNVWTVRALERDFSLGQNGFVATQDQKLIAYGALVGGRRVDYVEGARYFYFDARGQETDFGPVKTAGQVVVRKDRPDGIEVILASAHPAQLIPAQLAPNAARRLDLDIDHNPIATPRPINPNTPLSLTPTNRLISTLLMN